MENQYVDYRKTLKYSLNKTFSHNFKKVFISDKETGQGLELVIMKAQPQPTFTIKYNATLLKKGREILDISGETKGRTIAMGSSIFSYKQDYKKIANTLNKEAVQNFCSDLYDGIFRSDKKEIQDWWK
jgi:hypothetical protein